MVHYFVWYRVTCDTIGETRAARAAVDAVLADVARVTGIRGRLLVRRGQPDTWMEIHERVTESADFERELAAAVQRHDLARHIADSGRHVEAFVDVIPAPDEAGG